MLKILIPVFLMLSCSKQKYFNDSFNNISNFIVCEYLIKIERINLSEKSIYLYKGFSREFKNHSFCMRYFDGAPDESTSTFITWIDKGFTKICNTNQKVFITEEDFSFQNFNEDQAIFRLSDIYFTSKSSGCFIASRVCGSNCEEAKIYTFDCVGGNKCAIKLASYYFID